MQILFLRCDQCTLSLSNIFPSAYCLDCLLCRLGSSLDAVDGRDDLGHVFVAQNISVRVLHGDIFKIFSTAQREPTPLRLVLSASQNSQDVDLRGR